MQTIHRRKSPNFNQRLVGSQPVQPCWLVFHATEMIHAQDSLDRLCDPDSQVSAHYLIDEKGAIFNLVDETDRAWHAGVSWWQGQSNLNSLSIGIELQNMPGDSFPEDQITALIDLCRDIQTRRGLHPAAILSHSDIAPDRKYDPGVHFPWSQLAQAGIGFFPSPMPDQLPVFDDSVFFQLLGDIGYDPEADHRIEAFQRRYRPELVNNQGDAQCQALATQIRENFPQFKHLPFLNI